MEAQRVPAFEPADGRFAGYRGVAIRSAEADEDAFPVRMKNRSTRMLFASSSTS